MRGPRAFIIAGIAGLAAAAAAPGAWAGAASTPASGPHWHIVKSVKTGASGGFTAIVATGARTGWAFDGQGTTTPATAWQDSGGSWKKVAFPIEKSEVVVTAGASSPSDVWAFTRVRSTGGSRVLHWNGHRWSVARTFTRPIADASVAAADDVWVFGQAPTPTARALGGWHYDGHVWKQDGGNVQGGSALAPTYVWGYSGLTLEHWLGLRWWASQTPTSLPPKNGGNDPLITGVLALSRTDDFFFANGNTADDGGPLVIERYDGSIWHIVAKGNVGFGPMPEVSTDGSGGLWLPMYGPPSGSSFLVHYTAAGGLAKAALPAGPASIRIYAVSRVPGTTEQIAAGVTHASGHPDEDITGVILQYS
ncbi:MAG TPA: hypothetical protein VHZ33_35835 [Trebonia sp.]|jgi:hypothetical protein|nr:hypothetical protein [Trebonia sp.]